MKDRVKEVYRIFRELFTYGNSVVGEKDQEFQKWLKDGYDIRNISSKENNGDWPLSNKLRYENSDIWGVK